MCASSISGVDIDRETGLIGERECKQDRKSREGMRYAGAWSKGGLYNCDCSQISCRSLTA